MKKVIQPNVRKVYGASVQQQHQTEIQLNAVRKINSLLSTGAVSVTGPTQPRILKQKPQIYNVNSQQQKCYVCDEVCGVNGALLLDTFTTHSHTKLPNKIGRLIGDAFLVIVRADDVVCKRCVSLFNRMDNFETELERIRNNILGFICRKYGITEDEIRGGAPVNSGPPPSKVQKIATPSGTGTKIVTRVLSTADHDDGDDVQVQTRKIARSDGGSDVHDNTEVRTMPALVRTSTNNSPQVRRVITTSTPQGGGTPREPIKIYRCASCDHTTPDLKQFQSHYEHCRSTWPCKVCKRVFTTSQALKLHMQDKHPANDFTCNLCNLNFMNDAAYKRHIEVSHPDMKIVEGTAAGTASVTTAVSQASGGRTGVMYTCSICGWKTGERQAYEEHVRKHNKMKPFKCRICNQRFETRESASKHAKTHQPDFYKCGDCDSSFPQRELLMKHFEVRHKGAIAGQTTHKVVTTVVNSSSNTPTSQSVTTQKLLQETIDEALRDSGDALDTTKGIHFFSCNICSLTFIQENYYNQHMETHKRDAKKVAVTSAVGQLPTVSSVSAATAQRQSLIRQDVRSTNATILGTQSTTISDADLESIFEKMHADKGHDTDAVSAVQTTTSDNLVITKQSTAGGGITYNITIPQQQEEAAEGAGQGADWESGIFQTNEGEGGQVAAAGIDMPVLDNLDETEAGQQAQQEVVAHQQQHEEEATEVGGEDGGGGGGADGGATGPPVSMPSLDDDGDSQTATAQRQSLIRQDVRSTNATILGTQSTTISDADLESIFEKMHADKGHDTDAVSAVQTTTSDNLVITKQSTAGGGITYNITIPQQQEEAAEGAGQGADGKVIFQTNEGEGGQVAAAGIDMPVLDNLDETEAGQQAQQEVVAHQQQHEEEATEVGGEDGGGGGGADGGATGPPVSMPSLDDDGDSQSQTGHIDGVPLELDEMQTGVEGEQIKFILNENGQLLQLDNHIITTDAEGNQIIVQGADTEHLQQLLQSVAGLDGNTIQMIGGENNQMILVQQGDGEPQLIDASLLNADGHIVIQQAQDGESQSSEDVQIPTTVAYTTTGGQEDGVPEQVGEESVVQHAVDGEVIEGQEVVQGGDQPMETEEEVAKEVTEGEDEGSQHAEEEQVVKEDEQQQQQLQQGGGGGIKDDGEVVEETPVTSAQTTQSSEVFFNIDDLMGQPEAEQKNQMNK
uniref:C2H2-type domain-containing protein n=1 Tax=Lutzomyia longipalpis TaxID=7200 RepID=A0A1B0C8P6_LUTLO